MAERWWLSVRPWEGLLPVLLCALAAVNAPYWAGSFVPTHDTMFTFQAFHVFYNEWFYQGHLAHWLPYGTYGLPSDFYQLGFLSPMSYVAALVGGLLRVSNVLLLFKLSLLAEQLVWVLGLYLLCARLFRRRSTAALVCFGAIGGSVWYAQLFLNLRVFYLLPLMVYALFACFAERRLFWGWGVGLLAVAGLLGNPPYLASLWFFTCAIVAAVLWGAGLRDRRRWQVRPREHLPLLAVFIASLASYGLLLLHLAKFALSTAPGRDPATGGVGLQTFLTYGGRADLSQVLKSLVFGWPTHLPWGSGRDNTVYIGLLGVVFFVWAVLKVRTVPFLALLSALVALVCLSVGGWFATLVYYAFPTMAQYRHVGLVYGVVKFLLLICAGFGWEHFWSAHHRRRSLLAVLLGGLLLVDAAAGVSVFDIREAFRAAGWNLGTLVSAGWGSAAPVLWPATFGLRVGVYAALAGAAALAGLRMQRRARDTALRLALLLALCLDLLSYQAVVYAEAPHLSAAAVGQIDALRAQPLAFQMERLRAPTQPRSQQALQLVTRPGALATYALAYQWAQFDPCVSAFRVDWRSKRIIQLLRAMPEQSDQLQRVLGCESPKVYLVPGAVLPQVALGRAAAGRLHILGFNTNELLVETQTLAPGGAWLVYADAYHPGWRAMVNGRPVPIAEANLAFKAVQVPEGQATVRFWFYDGFYTILSKMMALLGALLGMVLLGICCRILFYLHPLRP